MVFFWPFHQTKLINSQVPLPVQHFGMNSNGKNTSTSIISIIIKINPFNLVTDECRINSQTRRRNFLNSFSSLASLLHVFRLLKMRTLSSWNIRCHLFLPDEMWHTTNDTVCKLILAFRFLLLLLFFWAEMKKKHSGKYQINTSFVWL